MAFTCPACLWISHNRNDELHSYCGHCHAFMESNLLPNGFQVGLIKALLAPPELAPERVLRVMATVNVYSVRSVAEASKSIRTLRRASAIEAGQRALLDYAMSTLAQLSKF
jgi:hypothetical protein